MEPDFWVVRLGWITDVAVLVLVVIVAVTIISGYFPLSAMKNDVLGMANFLRGGLTVLRSYLTNSSIEPTQTSTSTVLQVSATTTLQNATANATQSTTTMEQIVVGGGNSSLIGYALSQINQDRAAYGLLPVTLSSEGSGMQHALSMLQYGYFSHWDPPGLKPYMRYTLLGGTGSVDENIAIDQSSSCLGSTCVGNIDPKAAIAQMEDNMMYNDSICCNNGHKDNILDPQHQSVSIGIAYNSSTIYLVEDFIDSYINWSMAPNYQGGTVEMAGTLYPGYNISQILIGYDPSPTNMSVAQLNATTDYSYGSQVAGVVSNPYQYYQGIETVRANRYSVARGGNVDVSFSIANITKSYGAGEYTVLIWLDNSSTANSFIGSTYTLFINGGGEQYIPSGA